MQLTFVVYDQAQTRREAAEPAKDCTALKHQREEINSESQQNGDIRAVSEVK